MTLQRLTLTLDGITAGDYLQWVREPEPPALAVALRSIDVSADPLGDTIEAVLSWDVPPPRANEAAQVAGFPLTSEIVAIRSTTAKERNSSNPRTASFTSLPTSARRSGSSGTPARSRSRERTRTCC
jgi:hypothetical protein